MMKKTISIKADMIFSIISVVLCVAWGVQIIVSSFETKKYIEIYYALIPFIPAAVIFVSSLYTQSNRVNVWVLLSIFVMLCTLGVGYSTTTSLYSTNTGTYNFIYGVSVCAILFTAILECTYIYIANNQKSIPMDEDISSASPSVIVPLIAEQVVAMMGEKAAKVNTSVSGVYSGGVPSAMVAEGNPSVSDNSSDIQELNVDVPSSAFTGDIAGATATGAVIEGVATVGETGISAAGVGAAAAAGVVAAGVGAAVTATTVESTNGISETDPVLKICKFKFKDGKYSGQAYKGDDGKWVPHGCGVFESKTEQFCGQWRNGSKDGYGKESTKEYFTTGCWKNGVFHGWFCMEYDTYITAGMYINGLKQGLWVTAVEGHDGIKEEYWRQGGRVANLAATYVEVPKPSNQQVSQNSDVQTDNRLQSIIPGMEFASAEQSVPVHTDNKLQELIPGMEFAATQANAGTSEDEDVEFNPFGSTSVSEGSTSAESVLNDEKTSVKSKFCPQCGAKQASDAHFCVNCGNKLV